MAIIDMTIRIIRVAMMILVILIILKIANQMFFQT